MRLLHFRGDITDHLSLLFLGRAQIRPGGIHLGAVGTVEETPGERRRHAPLVGVECAGKTAVEVTPDVELWLQVEARQVKPGLLLRECRLCLAKLRPALGCLFEADLQGGRIGNLLWEIGDLGHAAWLYAHGVA